MARPNRLKASSGRAIYHAMNRTVRKQFMFTESLREWIYKRINFLASCFYVEIHAVAVLSNHYHLVFSIDPPTPDALDVQKRFERLQSLNKKPRSWMFKDELWHERFGDLSEFMKCLNQSIANEINRRGDSEGKVWDRRFKSTLIEDGPGLLACLAYVELNPVRAGLCKKPSEYRWCSAGRYALAGPKEAGVTVPSMSAFSGIAEKHRHDAWIVYVDHIAKLEKGLPSRLPDTWGAWEKLLEQKRIQHLHETCFHKTKWLVNSVILGSEAFCERWLNPVQVKKHIAVPFRELFPGLFNGRQRAGDFLN